MGEHEIGRGHPGEQGDLRVPAVGGERGAVGEFVRPVLLDDLLLGHVERDAAALHLEALAEQPDDPQQRERLLRRPVVDPPLYVRVVELGAAAYEGTVYVDRLRTAVRVEVDGPQHGRAGLVREQAGGTLGEPGRVQRDLLVREVQGRHAAVDLGVQGAAGCDERGDVGDRVPDTEASLAARQVHRLVEVVGGRRVDGEEGDVRRVAGGQAGWPRGFLKHFGREALGHVELGTQCAQGGPQGASAAPVTRMRRRGMGRA